MPFTYPLTSELSGERRISGGKAANLHRLAGHRFDVPPGFVVSARAFKLFARSINLWPLVSRKLSSARLLSSRSLDELSREIREAILKSSIPATVLREIQRSVVGLPSHLFAVRSSALIEDSLSSSWAGQFDSFLQIEARDVPEFVKKCWASLFNARAIAYNRRRYLKAERLALAVIVQSMISGRRSGVAFSIHPVTHNTNRIAIEATRGLATDVVSGRRLPFFAVLDKSSNVILKRTFATSQDSKLLSAGDLERLSSCVKRIERLFGYPVDVEWTLCHDRLFILQARAVTTRKAQLHKAPHSVYPQFSDYELTFKVVGLNFLFTDMLLAGFTHMHPLFTSYRGKFSQYFANGRMEYAAKEGLRWLASAKGFSRYKETFTRYYFTNIRVLDSVVDSPRLTSRSIKRFFQIVSRIFAFYSRTDFAFTNLTYIYADEDRVLRSNLRALSRFKDEARVWINNVSLEESSQLSRLTGRIAHEQSMSRTAVESYTVKELAKLVQGTSISSSVVRRRRLSFTVYAKGHRQVYLAGTESARFIRSWARLDRALASSQVKGQVAHKVGQFVTGTVKRISIDYSDMEKISEQIRHMRKGEILVAEFTAPELMAACRKAKAIITDLGGMLSHAAIVSRELGIPCVVGTHNATKALKSGDRVLVDLELGTVTKKKERASSRSSNY